jgi:DUF1680 family protein
MNRVDIMKKYLSVPAMLLPFALVLSPSAIAAITPAPYVVPAVVEDRQDMQIPDRVHLDVKSMLGARIQANTTTRLLETVDVDRLLEGYRKRPGCMTWDGEHIGKWIHAASLAWANSGDEKLRAKIASAVTELMKCQEADGYLGTYLPDNLGTTKPVSVEKVVAETAEALAAVPPPVPDCLPAVSESQSRTGNVKGSLIQGTLISTYDRTKQDQDWYAVTLAQPSVVGWVVFTHGANWPNGGWFDASKGKPQVQIQAVKDGPWKTVGELMDYPATTATDNKKITNKTGYSCTLAEPVKALSVRVIGRPASGDNPNGAFSSSSGLAAYTSPIAGGVNALSQNKAKSPKRWTEWDVWSHKYNLLGLLTWVRLSGDPSAMDACRKMGDLLCNTFGNEPGKLDFMKQAPFEGQVTVLEPMIMLYRMTGEPRYKDFCQYLMKCKAAKPRSFVATLLEKKRVDQVYATHAYTQLSFVNALLEWYRISGDKDLLTAAVNAWEDITAKRRYITGAISYRETFHDDFDLPNNNHVGETCATVTWMQFNAQLLRLTGQARYAQEIERTAYNQLASAQSPDGKAWTYYVGLVGTKPYSTNFTGFCCLSSGPRGPVLLPTCALTTDGEGVVVNLYDQANAQLKLRDGIGVAVNLTTRFPSEPNIAIDIKPEKPADFAVKLRIPTWCSNATLKLGGKTLPMTVGEDGYVAVRRTWQAGDRLNLVLPPNARVVAGEHNNLGRAAICYGPLVLATDTALDPAGERIQLNSTDIGALSLTPEPAKGIFHDWSDAQVFRITSMGNSALLAPISTAGADKKSTCYRVWLPFTSQPGANLAVGGTESVSRTRTPPGAHVDQRAGGWGSIIDGGEVLTYNNTKQDQDWYAVTLAKPASVGRVVFIHSWAFPSGGWFDTSAGKPQVQVQTEKDGPWTTVGELKSYPATTATDAKVLGPHSSGTRYTCTLSKPVTALAVRVIGKPACGNDPKQSFSSCMGMEIYER